MATKKIFSTKFFKKKNTKKNNIDDELSGFEEATNYNLYKYIQDPNEDKIDMKSKCLIVIQYKVSEIKPNILSIELLRRGFIIENVKEDLFITSISDMLLHRIVLSLGFPTKSYQNYSNFEKLRIGNEARNRALRMSSYNNLNGILDVWIAHNLKQYNEIAENTSNISIPFISKSWSFSSGNYNSLDSLEKTKLGRIFDYYGPQIAFYFAWVDFYTMLLVFPALFGLYIFLSPLFHGLWNGHKISDINLYDTIFIPFFSIFISIWSTSFLELWKRKSCEYAFKWKLLGIEDLEEDIQLSSATKNEVGDRSNRMILSFASLFIIIYLQIKIMFFYIDMHHSYEDKYTSFFMIHYPSFMYSFLPILFPFFFDSIIEKLNEFEKNPTKNSFEASYIYKKFALNFVNKFSALLYIAFWKKDIDMLRSLLLTQMTVGAIFNNLMELGTPYINLLKSKIFSTFKPKQDLENLKELDDILGFDETTISKKKSEKILNYEKNLDSYDLHEDYLEMIVQFGYVAMFSVVFPLIPLFALVNNFFEGSVDLLKLKSCRRPPFLLASSIGAWQTCFEFMSFVGVITNCYILATSSSHLYAIVPTAFSTYLDYENGKLIIMVCLEHCLILLKVILMCLVDDVPYRIKECLAKARVDAHSEIYKKRMDIYMEELKTQNEESAPTPPISTDFNKNETETFSPDNIISSQDFNQSNQEDANLVIEDEYQSDSSTDSRFSDKEDFEADEELIHTKNIEYIKNTIITPFGFDPISLMSIICSPLILSHILKLNPLLYLPFSLVYLSYYQSKKDRMDRCASVGIVSNPKILRYIKKDMPSWFSDPQFERLDWLNNILQKMWGMISIALEPSLIGIVNPYLDMYRPSFVSQLYMKSFNLGSIAPKIVGLKYINNDDDLTSIKFDIDFRWYSDAKIVLRLATGPIPMNIELSNVQFSTVCRLELCDITTKLPVVSSLNFCFLKKPFLDFSLKIAKLDIMSIGALDFNVTNLVRSIINSILQDIMIHPAKLSIPLSADTKIDSLEPIAILQIQVVSASNLPKPNFFSLDPFIEMKTIQNQTLKSSIKKSANPIWNEVFEFMVYDLENQVINFTIFNNGDVSSIDKIISSTKISLNKITNDNRSLPNEDGSKDFELNLKNFKVNKLKNQSTLSIKTNLIMIKKDDKIKSEDDPFNLIHSNISNLISKEDLKNDLLFNSYKLSNSMLITKDTNDQKIIDKRDSFSQISPSPSPFPTPKKPVPLTKTISKSFMKPSRKTSYLLSGVIKITILKISNFKVSKSSFSLFSKESCPFITINYGNISQKTKAVKYSENPSNSSGANEIHFHESFNFIINGANSTILEFKIYEKKVTNNKHIGTCIIDLKNELNHLTNSDSDKIDISSKYLFESNDLTNCNLYLKFSWSSNIYNNN